MKPNFNYFKVSFLLNRPMLGSGTETSIWHEHVIEKAKKEIKRANKLGARINKALDKYVGSEISKDKELMELQGTVRTFCQLLGEHIDVAENVKDLLEQAKGLEEKLTKELKSKNYVNATIFMRDINGYPMISTHMVLGNIKENLRIITNNGDKSILKSKVSIGETMALDVKAVEPFMKPSNDILRDLTDEELVEYKKDYLLTQGNYVKDPTGRILIERPIKFDRKGTIETAIAISECLPAKTSFSCTLRVRVSHCEETKAPIDESALERLFDLGKSNGFGPWRGSGNMGAYQFKLERLEDYVEKTEDGWK